MSIQPQSDLLAALRQNLRHFEESGENELSPDAAEVKRILLQRIATIESAMARLAKLATAAGKTIDTTDLDKEP